MVPRTVLTRSGPILVNVARPVNTVQSRTAVNNAGPMKNVINNAYSIARRPFYKITAANNSNFTKKVNIVKVTIVNTAKPKAVVNTVRQKAVLSAVKGNKGNVVKASTCWVWKPKTKVIDHVSKHNSASMLFKRFDYGNPQQDLKNKGVIDSGCSRYMIGNRSYLTNYEEIDGGFVAFGVSHKCVKKNSVLFTDIECVVLSPDFKLTGESHVLLKVPRKDNMYSVDLKKVIPFSWVFFLATKDETSEILKTFITGIENLIDLKVKVIRCDNGTEFKNKVMNQFCEMKGIKREFSVARTPQQNGVAERKNRTLIEAARTMLADSKLPTTFWAKAVNTACYVQNRVLVIKPHNKTPYELFLGRKPALSFMRPFGCPVTILNTLDHLGNGPNWLFDIDALTISMNYKPVVAGNQTNSNAGTKENIDAGLAGKKIVPDHEYILLPLLTSDLSLFKSSKDFPDVGFKPSGEEENMDSKHLENKDSEMPNIEEPRVHQEQDTNVNNTNNINTVIPTVNVADIENNVVDENIVYGCIDHPSMPNLEEIVYSDDDDEEVGAEADMNNLATTVHVSPIPTTRVHKDHPLE
ncbi:ribonuclease H-like domain-containing protein [Tanacetum coccineum]